MFQAEQLLFEYDLPGREVVALIGDEWAPGGGLVLGADGKLYGYGDRSAILQYDPATGILNNLTKPKDWGMVRQLTSGPEGSVYGVAAPPFHPGEDFFFVYSIEGKFTRLENLPGRGFENLAVASDGLVYVGRRGQSVYVSSSTSGMKSFYNKFLAPLTRWMRKWVPVPEGGGGGADYRYEDARLLVYKPGVFVRQGEVESVSIEPHTSVVTRAEVSGSWASVPALAWGGDGALYGVLSRASHLDTRWLFRHTPDEAERVTWVDAASVGFPWPRGASALVSASDGCLVAALGEQLAIYDPWDSTLLTSTLSISQGSRITALASGQDGEVYAGIGTSGSQSRLIAYDLVNGSTVDLGIPLTGTWEIYALTVAADGRVYGGGGAVGSDQESGQILFEYDPSAGVLTSTSLHLPASHRVRSLLAMPDGKVYLGTAAQFGSEGGFFVYDPTTDATTPLLVGGDVIALALGNDGLIYGSAATTFSDGYLFTYDPQHPRLLPSLISATRTGVTALLPGPDGAMYGVTGQYNSFYSGAAELIAFRTECLSGTLGAWERMTWETETPPGTRIVVDVLDREGNVLLRDVKSGDPLWSIDPVENPAIRLRATLFTSDERVTPVLKNWRADYTFECQQ